VLDNPADALLYAIKEHEVRRRYGESARLRVTQDFIVDEICRRFEELYDGIVTYQRRK
jgi:glycosyltransferase involved in cell wall biosynthesis